MYDNDDFYSILNSLASTTTTTQPETEQQTTTQSYSAPTTSYSPWAGDDDDYSVNANYEEQQNYNTSNQNYGVDEDQNNNAVYQVRPMETPMIQKEAPAVNLIKKRQKIQLHARMKIVASMFMVIVSALIFAIVWNFASASSMRATFADKQMEINALNESILALKDEYNSVSSEAVDEYITNGNYAEPTEDNTVVVDFESYYAESAVEDLPSNWFNDVCDFFARLFA